MAQTEKEVGREAARMLRSKLKSTISTSGLSLKNDKDSIGRATTSYRMVRGEPTHLNGIAVIMPRHGFIHSHGVDTTRSSHIMKTASGKTVARKLHPFKMKKTPILQNLLADNTIVDFVADEITRLRGEEVVLKIKEFLEE